MLEIVFFFLRTARRERERVNCLMQEELAESYFDGV